jgi:hypothetical protein
MQNSEKRRHRCTGTQEAEDIAIVGSTQTEVSRSRLSVESFTEVWFSLSKVLV